MELASSRSPVCGPRQVFGPARHGLGHIPRLPADRAHPDARNAVYTVPKQATRPRVQPSHRGWISHGTTCGSRRELVLFVCALLGLACNKDKQPLARPDIGTIDARGDNGAADGSDAANFGQGCEANSNCQPGSPLCVLIDTEQNFGICTAECTRDDPATELLNEDSCPADFTCGTFDFGGATFNYCLQECTPSLTTNPCPANTKTTCHPDSTQFTSLSQAVCWFSKCEDGRDCPVFAERGCASDQQCADLGADAFCDDDSQRCALPGNCTASGLCGAHTRGMDGVAVGSPCSSDLDCPGRGFCRRETDSDGSTSHRNGYCTIRGCIFGASEPRFRCPAGSTCHRLFVGGLCHKTCDPASEQDCRAHGADRGGDYECYDWSDLAIGGVRIADRAVCQAATRACNTLGRDGSGELRDCSLLAPDGNPNNMRCRASQTGVDLPPHDSRGICLDDTASGPFAPAPDGGGVDGGIGDAG